jgi:hypothetical protein
MIDLSRIENLLLKENYLLLLGFSGKFVPMRVIKRELVIYLYDPIAEGMISTEVPASTSTDGVRNLGWVAPRRPASSIIPSLPTNVLAIPAAKNRIYQLFYGIAPSACRVFKRLPAATAQENIEITNWDQSYPAFGFVDGFESPLDYPSPRTETFIPYAMDIEFGFANPLPYPIRPLLKFYINRLEIGIIKDVELVMKMLDGRVPCSIKTIGGINPFDYPIERTYEISGIELGATRDEVARALGVK